MTRCVNFGCGNRVIPGWENYDLYASNPAVSRLDLEQLPLPFEDGSIDRILLKEVLEHLWVSPYRFMMEIHRILKQGGVVTVELPLCASCVEHVRWFHTKRYFYHLLEGNDGNPQAHRLFELIRCRYVFAGWFRGLFPRVHIEWVMRKL